MTDGLLLTMMNPPADGDAEFNAWVDTEHLPERKTISGIRTAVRFRNKAESSPRYMAAYDLEDLAVLKSSAYQAIAGENLSPWSKRILAGATARFRFEGMRIGGGPAVLTLGGNGTLRELLLACWSGLPSRCDDEVAAMLEAHAAVAPDVIQSRAFVSDKDGRVDYLAIVESIHPFSTRGLTPDRWSTPSIACQFVHAFLPI